jgi:hypothetical protein
MATVSQRPSPLEPPLSRGTGQRGYGSPAPRAAARRGARCGRRSPPSCARCPMTALPVRPACVPMPASGWGADHGQRQRAEVLGPAAELCREDQLPDSDPSLPRGQDDGAGRTGVLGYRFTVEAGIVDSAEPTQGCGEPPGAQDARLAACRVPQERAGACPPAEPPRLVLVTGVDQQHPDHVSRVAGLERRATIPPSDCPAMTYGGPMPAAARAA